jgi:hypothetical protein
MFFHQSYPPVEAREANGSPEHCRSTALVSERARVPAYRDIDLECDVPGAGKGGRGKR